MSATGLIEGALERIRTTVGVKTVYGEPIKVDGKTIIPIAKVAYGAGAGAAPAAGAGPAAEKSAGPDAKGEAESEAREGGGAGAYAAPVGVVEISEGGTKFVPIGLKKKLAIVGAVSAAVGILLGLFFGRRHQ